MPITPLNLATRSVKTRHGQEGAARLVNCYAEATPDGKSAYAVYGCDGLETWATAGGSGVEALLNVDNDFVYGVAGGAVFRVTDAGTVFNLTGSIGGGLVTMAVNNRGTRQIAICSSETGIVKIVEGTTLSEFSDSDLPAGATSVCEIDGYFVYTYANGRVYHDAGNDATNVDPLAFSNAETELVRGIRRGRDLVLLGRDKIQFRQNTAGTPFAFTRVTDIDVGCRSGGSVATVDQTIAFLANDKTVRILDGYQARQVSTKEIERLVDEDNFQSAIRGFSWQRRGKTWYALKGDGWCKVLDVSSGDWHDRESYGFENWRGNCAVAFNDLDLVGDETTGKVFKQSSSVYTEDGGRMVVTVQLAPVHAFPYRMVANALYIDAVTGVGLNSASAEDSNPNLMLDWTLDGDTFGAEMLLPLGREAQVDRRVVARRLGQISSKGRTFRIRCSANVITAISGIAIDAEKLAP